jgi:hypothetical protein
MLVDNSLSILSYDLFILYVIVLATMALPSRLVLSKVVSPPTEASNC